MQVTRFLLLWILVLYQCCLQGPGSEGILNNDTHQQDHLRCAWSEFRLLRVSQSLHSSSNCHFSIGCQSLGRFHTPAIVSVSHQFPSRPVQSQEVPCTIMCRLHKSMVGVSLAHAKAFTGNPSSSPALGSYYSNPAKTHILCRPQSCARHLWSQIAHCKEYVL